ncbi:hypothetical protein BE15_13985 [Sorangium cellulosum]|uniref:Uncharacterized protein n=1 Tax=Sorangium cellulosum TaxID=56 RepID=A0A150QH15_SORCE|nr:hypothetical protein BE15_13985 [Sorangium cellulosum]
MRALAVGRGGEEIPSGPASGEGVLDGDVVAFGRSNTLDIPGALVLYIPSDSDALRMDGRLTRVVT